jgi:lipopolysaccharide transport system permease protein
MVKNTDQEGKTNHTKPSGTGYEYIIEPSGPAVFDWNEIWRYRELFYFFTWRDVRIKYKQATLGFLWVVLQPLLLMLIFTFFFGRTLQVPSDGLPYPVFVLSGLLMWSTFASGLSSAAASMVNNAAIIRKIYFPKLIIPVSSVLVAAFDFAMAFLVYLGLLIFYRQPVSLHALWCWPIALVVVSMATLGPGSLIAALNVKYRDFRYVVPFVVQALFFLTPVIYPIKILGYPWMQYVIALSPVFGAIELFRFPLTGSIADPVLVLISLGSTCFLLIAGLTYFKRTEDSFADFA